ncbi:hypothetical protein [Idiomarina zobellii]|nr:hypothetical protein [Idiomarina zobellii]
MTANSGEVQRVQNLYALLSGETIWLTQDRMAVVFGLAFPLYPSI